MTGGPTLLGGREIDFAITDNRLHGSCRIEAERNSRGHHISCCRCGCPWSLGNPLYSAREVDVEWLPSVDQPSCSSSELSREFASWARQAESYLQATQVEPAQTGRGCYLTFKQKPKVSVTTKGQVWKDSRVGFWIILARWCSYLNSAHANDRWTGQAAEVFDRIVGMAPLMTANWLPREGRFDDSSLQAVCVIGPSQARSCVRMHMSNLKPLPRLLSNSP